MLPHPSIGGEGGGAIGLADRVLHSMCTPTINTSIAKTRVSVTFDSALSHPAANQATTAAAIPVASETRQSTSWLPQLRVDDAMAVRMMAASEVATACFWLMPSKPTNAGTMMIPPPTPHSAEIAPVARP